VSHHDARPFLPAKWNADSSSSFRHLAQFLIDDRFQEIRSIARNYLNFVNRFKPYAKR